MKFTINYEINNDTLAIVPMMNQIVKIYEAEDKYLTKCTSTNIVNKSCNYFGSSLLERQNMTKRLINSSSKAPIIIEETRKIIFFPTSSPRETSCIWLAYNNISNYIKLVNKKTKIIFINNEEIIIPISYNIIDNQMTRCLKLKSELEKRKECL